LKQEALLSHVVDPGAGSYCLEAITDFIASEGWKSMQAIEAAGGYHKAQVDGVIARALRKSMAAKEKAVASRRSVFTGTNKYANISEKALERIDFAYLSDEPRATRNYEQLRLSTERYAAKTGKSPRVMLAEFGDVKIRAARSNFAANFFACAGFDISTRGFSCVNDVASIEADLIVLCSSDAEYLPLAAGVIAELKKLGRETPVIVAGNPESMEQLRAAGVVDFVHIRSNPIELLAAWQQRLGIED
jgi:methylmalonyl-CoA mutase